MLAELDDQIFNQQKIIYKALEDLRKLCFGPSWRTQLRYRQETIKLRLKTDGISEKEREWLKKENAEIEQRLQTVTY